MKPPTRNDVHRAWPSCHLATSCLLAILGVVSGCATILSGTKQDIRAIVIPEGASFTVYRWEGEKVAGPVSTPATITVPRPPYKESYVMVATAPGYCPRYWVSNTGMNPYTLLNALVGGAIGTIIDAASGACCAVSPEPIAPAFVAALEKEDGPCP